MPLKDKISIDARLSVVEHLIKDQQLNIVISTALKQIGDLERVVSKYRCKINPREVLQLNRALHALVPLKSALIASGNKQLQQLGDRLICVK